MQEVKDVFQRDFKGVWIPSEVYLDTNLKAQDRIILAIIHMYSENGICQLSNRELAQLSCCSERKVSASLAMLKEQNYVEVSKFDGRTRFLKIGKGENANVNR